MDRERDRNPQYPVDEQIRQNKPMVETVRHLAAKTLQRKAPADPEIDHGTGRSEEHRRPHELADRRLDAEREEVHARPEQIGVEREHAVAYDAANP